MRLGEVRLPPIADIPVRAEEVKMRRVSNSPLPLIIVCSSALLLAWLGQWGLSRYPVQPGHVAIARVSAIEQNPSRLPSGGDTVWVNNSTGSGSFNIYYRGDHCFTGKQVPVLQRGTSLSPLPNTCR